MKNKVFRKTRIALSVFLAILLFLFATVTFFLVASLTVDGSARVLPSYAREDLAPLLAKPREERTEEDYALLARQTGVLPREVLEGLSNEEILAFQSALFFRGEVRHDSVAFTTPHDTLWDPETGNAVVAPIVDLQPGDILVSSTCHTFGWRHGHAALYLSGGRLLQSFTLGYNSEATSASLANCVPWFQKAANFIVLRPKGCDEAARKAIADNAEQSLTDVPYSLTVGLFSPKDQGQTPAGTNCSHLVWQAYKNAGYDLDSDGGPVCTCRDIANSPLLEVVQYYGFDPAKGW